MGVIKKILFRGDILGKPRHRNMFLDMEENIHIHYRDLRIELSRGEFEDISSIFAKQSCELLQIIEDKKYQDGKLPNANQDDVRIWTESRLKHDLKYHPQRFSLEECGDGYHFHYRNYKLLIDKDEFHQIQRLFASMDLDGPYAATYAEVLQLLHANEVDFTLDAGNIPGETLAIASAQHHLPKIRDIFNYIGFHAAEDTESGLKRYTNDRLQVLVRAEKIRSALDYRYLRGLNSIVRLADYLFAQSVGIDPVELNLIKCNVLNMYYGVKAGTVTNIDTNPQAWLYSAANRQVIFPYKTVSSPADKTVAENLYRAWSTLLNGCQLAFVKPGKYTLPDEIQIALRKQVDTSLAHDVASYAAVNKIYLMGSALRAELGQYCVPFVHGKLAKLGSDIDILVEIDSRREVDVPGFWSLHLPQASNHCAVYHIAQIPLTNDGSEWRQQFPNIPFIEHLIDAYVYLPSSGYREEIDAFLKKFGAQLFYDRTRDGVLYQSDTEQRIAAWLTEFHEFREASVEKMKVSTENAIYKVFADEHEYILKLFKAAGNYHGSRVAEHTLYEAALIEQLVNRGIPTAKVVIPKQAGEGQIEGFPALLFERIPGFVQQRPEYPLESICAALAKIHQVQLIQPLTIECAFHFDDVCMIWLPLFDEYLNRRSYDEEISGAFSKLASFAALCFPGENRRHWFTRSLSVHNHGDVTPKNVIYDEATGARFFDFNNAFFGPRMVDLIDGAFEFSLAEKYIHLADFARFDAFITYYATHFPLSKEESEDLPHWLALIGIVKFIKEIRVMLQRPQEGLRRKRALAIAGFLESRAG